MVEHRTPDLKASRIARPLLLRLELAHSPPVTKPRRSRAAR